jgi:hypothetical protein
MKRRLLAPVLVLAAVAFARGDDPPKPGGQPPSGQPPAAPPQAPPPDPVKEQQFQDKAVDDAFALMQKGDITSVMEGLDRISKAHSGKATSQVVDFVLGRKEKHVAEFAGFALSVADPEGTLKEMTARLADPKALRPDQLEQMAALLTEVPAKEADKLLANDRFTKSNDEAVRRAAIFGLGRHRSDLGVAPAIEALSSSDAHTRSIACAALGRIGDARAVDALIHRLDDKDGPGGFAAVALGRMEDERIFPAIVAGLQGGGSVEKCKALVSCARAKHADKLVNMVKSGSEDVKIAACAALSKLKIQTLDAQKTLMEAMFSESDRWVRVAAFQALGQCCTAELGPVISKRTGQKDDEKLRYLYEISGDVGAKDVLPILEDAMWTERNDVMRHVAIDAFWRMRDAAAVTACEDKIRKATGKNFDHAMEILGMRKNRNGFDLALEILGQQKAGSHEDYVVELALERLTGHFFGPDVSTWREWIAKNPKFFEKEQAAIERAKWREEFLKENAGANNVTPATENSVQMALDFLARHQRADGSFDWNTFLKRCEEKTPCPTVAGVRIQMEDVGITSLCSLAFFGAGCGQAKGRYSGVLSRAMEYLLSRQMANGDYKKDDLIGGYNRPLALQAYAEAQLASVEDQTFLPYIQRGVDFIASIQAEKGGWRYRVVDNANDSSVVAWVLFASKAAEKAHAHVRRSIYEGCDMVLWKDQTHPVAEKEDFIRDVDPNYAFDVSYGKPYYEFWTGYQDAIFEKNKATTALGLMSRILLGYRRSHPFCIGSANKILTQIPAMLKKGETWKTWQPIPDYQCPMYFFYYATLSMHQMGGKYFAEWNKVLKEVLPNTQFKEGCERGSWASWGREDQAFSRLYTTAMATLTLETYYRYAPILQD